MAIGFHTLADLSPRIRANSGITIIGSLTHGLDILDAGRSAGLDKNQQEAIQHLDLTAILKMSGAEVPFQEPVAVEWDAPVNYPDVSEEERLAQNRHVFAELASELPLQLIEVRFGEPHDQHAIGSLGEVVHRLVWLDGVGR